MWFEDVMRMQISVRDKDGRAHPDEMAELLL